MITVRAANARGTANFGWLYSRHTFSFGRYYDPEFMGVSALRVINDDTVAPSAGFDTHGHRDMEIISFVTQGEIHHKDSYGHEMRLPAGEFQLMSAGSGIQHSEFNASSHDALKFLQIWIEPNQRGTTPSYQQKKFNQTSWLTEVITPDGRNDTLQIKQDAVVSRVVLAADAQQSQPIDAQRSYYLQLIRGELQLDGTRLSAGDGAAVTGQSQVQFSAISDVEALWFDLP
ncbi:pirin family protein [Shewanella avicenniae]|uniref:Pirin family protein n=1 Tax=Shewanella avicenniae TaxID=2814294 RepID=A0ABX7QTR9_9GAMM|nr:pirin family protein [Shewanella avicenniae]QSX34824.1 pirin family protein [Shewanella avicenniae]